tara:strand:- start:424 stop:1494 length:1071 start_codon:yes stop_codon:yes gene_type:complete
MYINKKEIKNFLIDKNKTIKDVLIVLNKAKFPDKKLCIVLDGSKVANVLTDGDIRRILIKEKDLTKKISGFLQKKFIFVYKNASEIDIINKIKKFQIEFIPVLDKNKRLISLFYKDDQDNLNQKKFDNEIFILAGGRGKRMFPLTDYTPKPLLQIGNKTILETLIISFKNQGFYNFSISVNYLSNKIVKYIKSKKYKDINIKFIYEKKKLGTAGPLSKLKINNNKPIIVINSDIYTRLNFFELLTFHNYKKNDITVGSHFYNQQIPYGVINIQKSKSEIIQEKPFFEHKISAGIYVVKPKFIKKIKKNKFLNMNDFINSEFKKKTKIGIFPIHELWMDIGDHGSFINAQNKIDQEW